MLCMRHANFPRSRASLLEDGDDDDDAHVAIDIHEHDRGHVVLVDVFFSDGQFDRW